MVLQEATKSEFDIHPLINLLHLLYKAKKVLVEVSQSCNMQGLGPLKFQRVTYINFLKYSRVYTSKEAPGANDDQAKIRLGKY